jgi:hypothetical protein
VPDDDDAGEIEMVLTRDRPDVVDGLADIEVRAGPPTARFSEPPVFDRPRRNPVRLESVGHCPKAPEAMRSRGAGPEAPTVDENDEGMGSCDWRNAQFAELVRVTPIAEATIRRLARKRCEIFRGHQALDACFIVGLSERRAADGNLPNGDDRRQQKRRPHFCPHRRIGEQYRSCAQPIDVPNRTARSGTCVE